jgi:hypothetical protein
MRDFELIMAIAKRAAALYRKHGTKLPPEFIAAEILLVHNEVVPLRLAELLAADDSNFAHDIAGIRKHLVFGNPCKLGDCFLPRFAKL